MVVKLKPANNSPAIVRGQTIAFYLQCVCVCAGLLVRLTTGAMGKAKRHASHVNDYTMYIPHYTKRIKLYIVLYVCRIFCLSFCRVLLRYNLCILTNYLPSFESFVQYTITKLIYIIKVCSFSICSSLMCLFYSKY